MNDFALRKVYMQLLGAFIVVAINKIHQLAKMSLCLKLRSGAVSPLMPILIPVFQSNLEKLKCILVLYFFMRSCCLKCPLVKSFSVV